MDLPRRKTLPHEVPLWIDPQKEIYFVTVNCQPKGTNHLAKADVARPLLESVRFRNEEFIWFAHVFLIMPDHIHALISFPPSEQTLPEVVTSWKRWTARKLGLTWQRDFFEHRLRSNESRRDKANYILANPVRKGLVRMSEEWPYVFIPKPTG